MPGGRLGGGRFDVDEKVWSVQPDLQGSDFGGRGLKNFRGGFVILAALFWLYCGTLQMLVSVRFDPGTGRFLRLS